MYASMLVSPFYMGLCLCGYTDAINTDENDSCKYHLEINVPLCPTTIAVGTITSGMVDKKVNNCNNDKVSNILIHDILIDKDTPLPVQIMKTFYLSPECKHNHDTICILQFFSNSNIDKRYNVLANIESVEESNNVEIIMELTLEGVLRLSLNGCPIVLLS